MKVMIVVTHLLGTGHLSRAITLARAFKANGHSVRLISGGMAAPQLDVAGVGLINLPPLRSDGTNFTRLLTETEAVADEAYLNTRRAVLVDALEQYTPDVLITELYPFGRRVLTSEFLALLQAAQDLPTRPLVLSSIRDILAPPSKPSKATRADDIVAQHYDGVLVHSDDRATRLNASWPVSESLASKLYYTGYVAPPPAPLHPERAGHGEILVSSGGGGVGQAIFRTAIEAARKIPNRRWRLLVGGQNAAIRIAKLRTQAAGAPVTIEPVRPDFRQMLHHADALVGMCGYNTSMDLLQSGIPAVLIPFDDGNEVEQGLRAQSLSKLPGIAVVRNADLAPDALNHALDKVLTTGRRTEMALNFDGAARSARLAENLRKGQV